MPVNPEKIFQALYDTIFDSLTTVPSSLAGKDPVAKKDQIYLTFLSPGEPIDEDQLRDQWSPGNENGSLTKAEIFARFVDDVPKAQALHAPNGNSVDSMYGEITGAQPKPQPIAPDVEAAYQEAKNFLYAETTIKDLAGNPITVEGKSPAYSNYELKEELYRKELEKYLLAYNQLDFSKTEDQRRWSILGPTLQMQVDRAWSDWVAAQKNKVDNYLDTMAQYGISDTTTILANARKIWESSARPSAFLGAASLWHWTAAFPANWSEPEAANDFVEITIKSGSERLNQSSDFTQWSGGASLFFWYYLPGDVGGGASGSSEKQKTSESTENLEISFKLGRVRIVRPWLNASLFRLGGWYVPGRPSDSYSNGQRFGNEKEFPLLPTGMIVARDIRISANWAKSDLEIIKSKLSAGGSFGWGPFRISGSYSKLKSSKNFTSSFDDRTITVPGIQIIAWENTVVPRCPQIE